MPDVVESLREVVEFLERSGHAYAVGGAFALAVWGAPRATKDIDVTLWCEPNDTKTALEAFIVAGAEGDISKAVERAEREGLAVLKWGGIRLDVFFPSIPFYAEALKRRVRAALPGVGEVWVLSAEALVVFKLLFFRPKDIVDLQLIIRVQGQKLDTGFVMAELESAVGPADERVVWWIQATSGR